MNALSASFGALLIVLVLARMVSPPDLGVFGVSFVAFLAVRAIAGLGIGRAIAGCRVDPEEIAPTGMTISVAVGVLVCAGLYVAAPAFAAFMGAPPAASAVRLLGLTAVITGITAVPRGMLQRRAPGSRVMVDQAGNWIGAAVTLGLVAGRFGVTSLALGALAGSLTSAGLFVALAPGSVRIGLSRRHAADLLRAALPFAVSSALMCAVATADLVVVGHLLRARPLGLYLLALCCASWPINMLSQPVRDMMPGALARFQRSPKLAASVFRSSARLLAWVTVPTSILIASSSGPLINVLYGPAWASAAPVLVWLAPLAVLRVFYEIANDFLVMSVSPRKPLPFQLVWLAVLLPALVAGARLAGLVGVAISGLAVAAVMVFVWYFVVGSATARLVPRAAALRPLIVVGVGLAASGALEMIRRDDLRFVIGAAVTLVVMSLLSYRIRAVLTALRRAAAAAGSWSAGPLQPVLGTGIESRLYPVLSAVPSAPVRRAGSSGDTPDASSLSTKVRVGARWSMLNSIVMRVCSSFVSIFLARTVFGPRVWGLYAVSQVALVLLLSANELGICAAIVRWDGNVRTIARTVLTLSVASSTVIYVGVYAMAPHIARMLHAPGATEVVRVLCICVIIDSFAGVPAVLLQRRFAQGRQMVVDSLNFLISTSIMLWLAFTGHGALSFAWAAVAGCTVAAIASTVLAPGVLPGWNTRDARRLLRFGLPLAGASFLVLAVFNVDTVIVGATLGPVMLGFYALAFNVSSWPLTVVSQAATRVSFAGFSRVADSSLRLAEAFTRGLAVLMALTVPACVLFATLAEPLIHAVYGQRWTYAAPALSLLAVLGLLRVAYTLMYDCVAAAGMRRLLMYIQALWLGALIPVLLVGARTHGIVGVGAGHLLVAAFVVGPAYVWALKRAGITVRAMARACLRPFAGGLLMAVVSLLVIHVAGKGLAGLIAAGCAGFAVYIPVIFPMRVLGRSPRVSGAAATPVNEASAG
jgi:PST family polysaccharide transporter